MAFRVAISRNQSENCPFLVLLLVSACPPSGDPGRSLSRKPGYVVLRLSKSRQSRTAGGGFTGLPRPHRDMCLNFQVPPRCGQVYCSPQNCHPPLRLAGNTRSGPGYDCFVVVGGGWCEHGAG